MLASAETAPPAFRSAEAGKPRSARSLIRAFLSSLLLGLLLLPAACGGPPSRLPPLSNAPLTDYHLGPGDQLRIITFGEEQLTGEFRVSANGDIALPLVGTIHAAGLTPAELEQTTAAALRNAKLFKNPSVTVEVVAYRPVFVLGEVARPGQYPYQPGMTVVTAVAVAGGFTYRAIDDAFSIVRTSGGKAEEGRAKRDTPMQPGDVLTVYERRF